ncbi:MAG: HD domain-containing protein [Candidatus Omnitrophica bacterium]|nr:HD domain-containing protein [Candidatus Omnitrophota bacterium]
MPEPIIKIKPITGESLTKKLSISFFFMSIIPILLMMYIVGVIGYDVFMVKLPHIRLTIALSVLLVTVMFVFLRYNVQMIVSVMKTAKTIAGGDYAKKIDVESKDEIGQLAKSFNRITVDLEAKIKELEESKGIIQDIFRKIGAALSTTGGIDQLLELIIETIVKGVYAESGCIMLLEDNELKVRVAYGLEDSLIAKLSIKSGEGVIGLSAKEKRIMITSYTGEPLVADADRGRFYYKNVISVPFFYKDECLGVLAIFDKKSQSGFGEDDKLLISNIAFQAAIAIANDKLNEDAEKTYIETITALAMAVEAKDAYSRGHLDRVSRLVVDFAKKLGLSGKTAEILKDGAKLHDLGKIGIRDDILCKQGPLTKEEQNELEKHVIIGENILRPIRKLAPLCDMVRHHQEWWNGTGYPDSLKGEEIPLTARILKIIDAYDAMSTDRPYRKALSKEEIKQEFQKGSGSEFDANLTKKFLEMI